MNTSKPKVSVIIVNYNTKEILEDCLINLKNKYANLEIIVVDNSSPDNTYNELKHKYSYAKFYLQPNNGLAAGQNYGASKSTGKYLLFLGSDAFPKKECIDLLTTYMSIKKDVGIITPKLLLRDGSIDMDCHRGIPTPWAALTHFSKLNKLFPKSTLFNKYFMEYEDLNKPHEIGLCISHFMLTSAEIFKKINGFDPDYFVYGEDVDYCYRVKKLGYKVIYYPDAQALHYKGVSVGIRKQTKDLSTANKETKIKMVKSTTKAMEIFYRKHMRKKYGSFFTSFVLVGINFLANIRILKFKYFS